MILNLQKKNKKVFKSILEGLIIIFLVYNAVEMSTDNKLICSIEVQCSNSRPETQLWNDTFSITVLYV